MSLYEYAPLDYSKNEIRILRFRQPTTSGKSISQYTLQHVSLDDMLPTYQRYLQEHMPTTPFSTVRGWIEKQRAAEFQEGTGLDKVQMDAWRFSLEYGEDVPIRSDHVLIPSRFNWGDFEAISYCWGSSVRDRDILVDGKIMRVTSNLEALLKDLQQLPEALSGIGFWLDGLCINQEDMLEKSQQVSLMSRIYSQAMSTVIWLGISTSISDKAIEEILTAFGHCHLTCADLSWGNWTPSAEESLSPRVLLTSAHWLSAHWASIINLCSRQYFERMWIIQELALNRNMTIFLCGDRRFSRVHLLTVCIFARSYAENIAYTLGTDLSQGSRIQSKLKLVWDTIADVQGLIKPVDFAEDLDQLLHVVRKAKATDSRDKVYGMLGLLPQDIAGQILPDYSKTQDEVFNDLAIIILRRCQRLDELLSWCVFSEVSTTPSWVPDWTLAHNRRHLQSFRKHKAGGQSVASWSFCSREFGLCVKTVRLGQVRSASLPTRALLPYKATAGRAASHAPDDRLYGRYMDKERLSTALNRTLVRAHKGYDCDNLTDLPWTDWRNKSEHHLDRNPDLSDTWQYFDRFRQSNASMVIFSANLKEFFADVDAPDPLFDYLDFTYFSRGSEHDYYLGRAATGLQHRRLCTTETGYLCLVPDEVEVGDMVVIILGCNYPVLLRPFEDGFKYVGECHVDGMMDGEAVDAAARGEYEVEGIVLL